MHLHGDPNGDDTASVSDTEGSIPRHQAQLRSHLELWRGFAWDANAYFVGRLPAQAVASYARLDTQLTWRLRESVGLSLAGRQSELREAIARVLGAREQKGAIPLITRYSLHDAREPSASLRILLAEDNAVNQRLASRLLEKRGHFVAVAGNGREALAALEKESFDLVLMDMQMPVMDGLKQLRRFERKREPAERTCR
jgi:PleD family two-component response regulator